MVRSRIQAGKNHRKASRRVRDAGGVVARSLTHRRRIVSFYQECPEGYEVDHIVAVANGGSHTLRNLQYLTKEENSRKGNR